jgi:hypothetical protein
VLNAKGGEIKAKVNGSATTCEFWKPLVNFENNRVRTIDLSKILLLQNLISCGGEFFIMGKKGVVDTWSIFHWNISWFSQTSVFDLEIGKRIWITKTNQVVVKNDPNMSNLGQKQFGPQLHWCCTSFDCFWMCWHKSPKRGRLKGKCALWQFNNVLVIKCTTQLIKFLCAK